MRRLLIPTAICMLLAAGGCSHTSDTLPSPGSHVPITFMIKVPQADTTGTSRHREYVSPATQAIAINKQAFNVTPSSPNCTTQSAALVCSFTVDAPNLGPATFTIATYDLPLTSTGATQGNQLSTGSTTATIFAGQQNVVKATLNGVPAHVSISIASANLTPPIGQQETAPVSLDVHDADGNHLAFWADADDVVPGDTNGISDVFVRDLTAGTTTRASIPARGGQMRRVEIARALLHRPRLLVLDEPTVGLDITSRADILGHVRRLVAEEGVGVLWATHLIDEAADTDQVIVLHQGHVLGDGPAAKLVADTGAATLREAFTILTGGPAAAGEAA